MEESTGSVVASNSDFLFEDFVEGVLQSSAIAIAIGQVDSQISATSGAAASVISEGRRSPQTREYKIKVAWGDPQSHLSPEIYPTPTPTPAVDGDEASDLCGSSSSQGFGRSECSFPFAHCPVVEESFRQIKSAPLEIYPHMANEATQRPRSASCCSKSSQTLFSIPEEKHTDSVDVLLPFREAVCPENELPSDIPDKDSVVQTMGDQKRVSFWKKIWSRVRRSKRRQAKDSPLPNSEVSRLHFSFQYHSYFSNAPKCKKKM